MRLVPAQPWVCLMYHEISSATSGVAGGREHFSVPQVAFEEQLDAILAEQMTGCSIETALRMNGPRVAISFDDGTADAYERAFPALRDREMSATFFVTTDWVDRPGFVTWAQLREMKGAGMSIQSHSRSHPFLSELDATSLREELCGSKSELDRQLGQDTDQIGLPGGDAPRGRLFRTLAEAGYRVVATSRWGVNRPGGRGTLAAIRRCTVRGVPSPTQFRRIVRGDPLLVLRRRGREVLLAALRDGLGPSRYARWRRRVLAAAARLPVGNRAR